MPDILYFAWLRDRLGHDREAISLPSGVTRVSDLVQMLHDRGGEYGEIFGQPELVRVAVNQSFAALDTCIGPDDEIAFFPPVTGDSSAMPRIHIRVQTEIFDPTHESASLLAGHSDVGAMASFIGMVRGDGGLRSLELEHYPGMTESMMTRIAESAATRFGLSGCTIIHRVGRLGVGAPIVLVICTAAHRGTAFQAVEFVMDWLKSRAPFWKKEEFSDGRTQWVQPREHDAQCLRRWDDADGNSLDIPAGR